MKRHTRFSIFLFCFAFLAAECTAEDLGKGYSRKGGFVFFEGKRIDQEGAHDIKKFSRAAGRKLTLCSKVDAASFEVLSEEYTKDKNKVYYKWISPGRFWVVELPKADAATFESVGFNLARDKNHVWWYGKILPGVDAASLQIVNSGFVWKDDHHVWYQHKKIAGADPVTFKHLEQAFYRDAENVYWSDTILKGADPHTFRTFGENSSYGADKNMVWGSTKPLPFLDAPTFDVVHQSVYKDNKGVYAKGIRIDKAEPKTFHKIADLDQHFTSLLADGKGYFIFLPYRGEVFRLENRGKLLYISRPIHHAVGKGPHKQIAVSSGELTKEGWMNQKVVPAPKLRGRNIPAVEKHLMRIYREHFNKAWDIIRARNKKNHETKK
jgi:hypothetical protein